MPQSRKSPQKPDSAGKSPKPDYARKSPSRSSKESLSHQFCERPKSASWTSVSSRGDKKKTSSQKLHCEEVEPGSLKSFSSSEYGPQKWQISVRSQCDKILESVLRNSQDANNQIVCITEDEQRKVARQTLKQVEHYLKNKLKTLEEYVQNWAKESIAEMLKQEKGTQDASIDEIQILIYEVTRKRIEAARYEERKIAAEKVQAIQRDGERELGKIQKNYAERRDLMIGNTTKQRHQEIKDATVEVQQLRNEMSTKDAEYQKTLRIFEDRVEELDVEIRSLHKKCKDLMNKKVQIEREIGDTNNQLIQFLDLAFKATDRSSDEQLKEPGATMPDV